MITLSGGIFTAGRRRRRSPLAGADAPEPIWCEQLQHCRRRSRAATPWIWRTIDHRFDARQRRQQDGQQAIALPRR
jgi:hypothetical protein